MKANELMVGDWVYNRIADITFQVYPQFFSQWHDKPEQFEATIQPIPLTAEIFEKNFQEFLSGINLMYQLKGPYCIMNLDGQWVFGLVKVDGENSLRYPLVKISFVHQLQHALRLCGVEKEITL